MRKSILFERVLLTRQLATEMQSPDQSTNVTSATTKRALLKFPRMII